MSGNYTIKSLEIKNFRQYRDVRIEFSQDADKMITVLQGSNGSGKTNIMNAITWCLYGKEKHLGGDEKGLPTVNTKALQEKPNGVINMHVKLVIADSDGEKFKLTRKLILFNNGGINIAKDKTGVLIPVGSTPTIDKIFQWYEPSHGWQSTKYFDLGIRQLIPEDLAKYFLFDGEKLITFFENAENIKKGIEDVSQIQITQKTVSTLEKLCKDITKQAKDISPRAEEYRQRLNEVSRDLDNIKTKIERTKADMAAKEKDIQTIESIIEKSKDVGGYQQEAIEAKKSIQKTKNLLDHISKKRAKYILERYYPVRAFSSMDDTLGHIEKKVDDGTLPPKIRSPFLSDLLESGRCICGNDISDGTQAGKRVSDLLKKEQYSSIDDLCTEIKYELNHILGSIAETKSEMIDFDKEIDGLEEKLTNEKDRRADLEQRIGKSDVISIREQQGKKSNLQEDVLRLTSELGRYSSERDSLRSREQSLETEFNRELKKEKKHDRLFQQQKFCEDALRGLRKVRDDLLCDVGQKVERYTRQYFLQLLWKKDTYDDVTIDDGYSITARHVDGYEVRDNLSAGEKLILALSFMAALRKVTIFRFPLIMDTPLGRVSGEPGHNIAMLLPKFLRGNQITILVTDREYHAHIQDYGSAQKFPPMRDTIRQYVGADYSIDFKDGESKVVKS